MKIIHIIYDNVHNPWLGGGGAVRTHEIYKRLSKKHDVTIITGNFKNFRTDIDGLKYKNLGLAQNYVLSRLSFICLMLLYMPFVRADVIIEDIGVPSPMVLTAFKKNNIASMQFIPNDSYVKKRKWLGKLVIILFRIGLKHYKNIVTVSEYARKYILRFNTNGNVIVIPNGINMPLLPTPSLRYRSYILYLGRIDYIGKGLDILLASLQKLKLENIIIPTRIAGSGESADIKMLQQKIVEYGLSDIVKLVGHVEKSQKAHLLANASILILPSRNENSPISIIEAFTYSVPVVGTDVGGLGELIKKSKGGICVRPSDVDDLKLGIKKLWCDENSSKAYGENGLRYALENTWDNIALTFEDYLLDLDKSK